MIAMVTAGAVAQEIAPQDKGYREIGRPEAGIRQGYQAGGRKEYSHRGNPPSQHALEKSDPKNASPLRPHEIQMQASADGISDDGEGNRNKGAQIRNG